MLARIMKEPGIARPHAIVKVIFTCQWKLTGKTDYTKCNHTCVW